MFNEFERGRGSRDYFLWHEQYLVLVHALGYTLHSFIALPPFPPPPQVFYTSTSCVCVLVISSMAVIKETDENEN